MQNLGLVLLIFGFVFFCIAGFVDAVDKARFIAIGLACVSAASIFGGLARVFGT